MPTQAPPRQFYTILGLQSLASPSDISSAYRHLSLRTPAPADIHEAYLVLSDPQRKAVYDQYGTEGLREGVPAHEGYAGYKGGWTYHGRDNDVFKEFHGGNNTFADYNPPTSYSKIPLQGPQTKYQHLIPGQQPTQHELIRHKLQLTLEEIYTGVQKTVVIPIQCLQADQTTTSIEQKKFVVNVPPASLAGTTFPYQRGGTSGGNQVTGDVIIEIEQLDHPRFKRMGENLLYTHSLTLLKALTGSSMSIETLDGRIINLALNEVISPKYQKIVHGEGITDKGDLIVTFDLEFPTYLNLNQKEKVKAALAA